MRKIWAYISAWYLCTFLPRRFDYVQTWRECVLDQVRIMENRALERQVIDENEFDEMVFAEFPNATKEDIRFARRRVFG
jgi:hypothetical protein